MSDLNAAAQRLRDSVAALPENEGGVWRYERDEFRVVSGTGRSMAVGAFDEDEPSLRHIATTASPPTVTLLADLLDAFAAGELIVASRSVHDLVDALASAILHTDQHEDGKT